MQYYILSYWYFTMKKYIWYWSVGLAATMLCCQPRLVPPGSNGGQCATPEILLIKLVIWVDSAQRKWASALAGVLHVRLELKIWAGALCWLVAPMNVLVLGWKLKPDVLDKNSTQTDIASAHLRITSAETELSRIAPCISRINTRSMQLCYDRLTWVTSPKVTSVRHKMAKVRAMFTNSIKHATYDDMAHYNLNLLRLSAVYSNKLKIFKFINLHN